MRERRPSGLRLLLPLFFLLLVSCTGVRVSSDHDPDVDFSRYRTYRWAESPSPAGSGLREESLFTHPFLAGRLRHAVDAALADRGFRLKGEEDADFTVSVRFSSRTVEFACPDPAFSWHYRYGFGPSLRRESWWWGGYPFSMQCRRELFLCVIIGDGRSGKPLWSGSAWEPDGWEEGGSQQRRRIERIVDKLLRRFPPPPGAR